MKLCLTFKDPDILSEEQNMFVHDLKMKLVRELGISEEAASVEADKRFDGAFQKLLNQYMSHGEYITIEFDSDTQSVRVVPNKELDW